MVPEKEILPFLIEERGKALYQLGDLEEPYFSLCRWWGAYRQGERSALLLKYTGLDIPTLISLGNSVDIGAILGTPFVVEASQYCHIQREHLEVFGNRLGLKDLKTSLRMVATPSSFRPRGNTGRVRVLSSNDLEELGELFRHHYPGNFFLPHMLEMGLYAGISEDGSLIAAGGTHTLSKKHGVAALGNIVTHSEHRGRGLASSVVSYLAERLFEDVDLIGLNVHENNTAAIAVYDKLGFTVNNRFHECVGLG